MDLYEWSKKECRIACNIENPNYNFDNPQDWDYGCSCYKSALKAYHNLLDDGHSGCSFSFTKNILIRLMNDLPLTPITDEDFFTDENKVKEFEDCKWLKERGLKSHIQCPRMSSLFREETIDGKVTYTDINRAYFIDTDKPELAYTSNTDFLDELFPITMPYIPSVNKYKIYAQDCLYDKNNGDVDTRAILYMITPYNERVELNIYKAEENHKWKIISKEEYLYRYNNRIIKK